MIDQAGPKRKNPNPQGKGLVPVLQDIGALTTQRAAAKSPLDFLRDYCLSSLVLAADFRFKPVPGRDYYLYSAEAGWTLSLVSPDEWRDKIPGVHIACCLLRRDMTWQVDFTSLDDYEEERRKIENFATGFGENISNVRDIEDNLPFFAANLPYYRRVLATGLAASLRHSMPQTDSLVTFLETVESPARLLSDEGADNLVIG